MNTTGRKTVKARTTSAPKKIEKTSAAKTSVPSDGPGATAMLDGSTKSAPSHEDIALRAYQLYLARGSEPGHESEDWLTAEAELSA